MVMLAIQALNLASLQACHGNKGNNKRNISKNPNSRRHISMLFTKPDPGFELGIEKQIQLAAGWRFLTG